jgi:hypothetical protein
MDNLAITGTAQAYVSNCTVNNNVVKSSSGYVEIINSELQCISGIQISGAGITIINGNKNVGVAVSNASAQVIIKGCNSVVTPSASAGNLAIVDCIVTALGGNAITITGASTTLTLANSQVLVQAGNNVAPISVAGIYSIINTIYDKPGSTITGTSTNSIDYFQYINADNITTNGLTVTGSIIVSGSVINTLTSSFAISASQATSASFATTASYVLNAVSASYALNGGVTQLLAGPNVTLSPINGLGQVTVSATLSGSTSFNTATGSYGSFYDTTIQTNPVGNIPRSMSLNSTDITNGVSISGSTSPFNTYIKTENAGVYNIQFSAQIDKTDSGTDEIVIWLRKNGIDLTDTATTITLSGNNDKQVAAWNWFVTSAANDYYQIIWLSADTDLRLLAEPISGTHPGIPSVIVTANRVDQFLSNTGSFSGSFTGTLTGTASFASFAISASHASTASFVNTLNQPVTISGSFTVFTGSAVEFQVIDTGVKIGNLQTDIHSVTGSLRISGSASGSFSGSFQGNGSGLTNIPASGITGLNLSQIASGSFTASISPSTGFAVNTSASITGSLTVSASTVAATLQGSGSTVLTVNGSLGNLFQVTDTLSGSLFSVNTISGLPVIEAFSDNTVRIGQFGQRALFVSQSKVGIGKESALNGILDVSGSVTVTGSVIATSFTGSLLGTASLATTSSYVLNAVSASFASTASFVNPLNQNVIITGSLTVITGSLVEFQVTNTGVKIGNASTDVNTVTGSLQVAGQTRISGSFNTAISGTILTVVGSGSTQPIFTVQGSQGELFSVTDSLTGSLFSVNDISGLPILEVFSDSTTNMGNYLAPALYTTNKITQTNSGSFVVYSLPTASYDGAFYDYTVRSGSNARAGQIMAIWSGSSVNFTETTTTSFGSTSAINFTVIVSGSNMVLTGSSATGSWTIKTIIRSI